MKEWDYSWPQTNKAKKPKSPSVVPTMAESEDELKGPAKTQKGWPVTSDSKSEMLAPAKYLTPQNTFGGQGKVER